MASQHLVFSFAGQGYPPVEAARDLYRTSEVFHRAIVNVQETIDGLSRNGTISENTHVPLTEYLEEDEIRPPYAASFDQPAGAAQHPLPPSASLVIVSAQYALGRMLESWGVSPQSVMAYSLGEIVAGTFTGSYTLAAVMKLLARREELLENRSLFPQKGGLALVFTDGDAIKQVLAREGLLGTVDIGGFSSPIATCVAGDAAQLDIALEKFSNNDIGFKRVALDIGMHSQHVQALADHVRSSPDIFPEHDSKDCKVVPGIDHWSSLGFQMPTGSPLNANHYATVLRRPLRYRDCVQGIFQKHMDEQPDRELVFLDMGMGPGQLYKSIAATVEHTPEWQRGQVRAMAGIDPVEAGDAKAKIGWAESQLRENLGKANVLFQKNSSAPVVTASLDLTPTKPNPDVTTAPASSIMSSPHLRKRFEDAIAEQKASHIHISGKHNVINPDSALVEEMIDFDLKADIPGFIDLLMIEIASSVDLDKSHIPITRDELDSEQDLMRKAIERLERFGRSGVDSIVFSGKITDQEVMALNLQHSAGHARYGGRVHFWPEGPIEQSSRDTLGSPVSDDPRIHVTIIWRYKSWTMPKVQGQARRALPAQPNILPGPRPTSWNLRIQHAMVDGQHGPINLEDTLGQTVPMMKAVQKFALYEHLTRQGHFGTSRIHKWGLGEPNEEPPYNGNRNFSGGMQSTQRDAQGSMQSSRNS